MYWIYTYMCYVTEDNPHWNTMISWGCFTCSRFGVVMPRDIIRWNHPGKDGDLSRHGIFSPVKIWCYYSGNTMGIYIYDYIYDRDFSYLFIRCHSDVTANDSLYICVPAPNSRTFQVDEFLQIIQAYLYIHCGNFPYMDSIYVTLKLWWCFSHPGGNHKKFRIFHRDDCTDPMNPSPPWIDPTRNTGGTRGVVYAGTQ